MSNELIPCTPELDRLKEFLAETRAVRIAEEVRDIMRHRRLIAEYYDGIPPYSEEELLNTPWVGRG